MKKNIKEQFITWNTLIDAVLYYSQHQPEKIAYTFLEYSGKEQSEKNITYHELDRQAKNIASCLQNYQATGKRAILLYNSGLEYICAFFGCLYAGVIPVPAYPPQTSRFFAPRLKHIIPDSAAEFALTTLPIFEHLQNHHNEFFAVYNLKWITTDNPEADLSGKWVLPDTLTKDSIAFFQYTSGSTSTPKGVIVTHDNLMHNIRLIISCFSPLLEDEADEELNGVIWLPPYHDMGLIGGILSLPVIGCTVRLMSHYSFIQKPFRWLNAISTYKAQISAAPNFTFDLCSDKITEEERNLLDLSSLKLVFNGAEPINYKSMERFTRIFSPNGFKHKAFFPCYGLAESTLIVSGGAMDSLPLVKAFDKLALENNKVIPVSTGDKNSRLLVGCGGKLGDGIIMIVQPDSCKRCAGDEVGEIWLKSRSVTNGYWNNPEKTNESFKNCLSGEQDNSYLRTGDLGFIWEEELYITGRLKDLIIIDGRNINPNDVEQHVENAHLSLKKNSNAAFAIDNEGTESLVVVQEIQKHTIADYNIADIKAIIIKHIKNELDLDLFDIIFIKTGTIPRTSSGKIQRHVCREAYLNNNLFRITG